MATNKRTYPNDYFAWYNDDTRLGIVTLDTASDSSERTSEKYDSFQGTGDLTGTITNMITDGSTVTVTCSAAHSLATDDRITISGTRHYDESYAVTVTDSTTFTFASSAVEATADTISSLAVTDFTATGIASEAHGYLIGDVVYIDASNNTYDEEVTITGVAGTAFAYTTSEGDVSDLTGTIGDTGSFTSLFINDGLRITYHAKYETVSALTDNLQTGSGVDSGLHPAIVCFVKARLYEDQGDMEKSSYFRKMYDKMLMQYPSRRSGVRSLAVPYM